MWYLDFTMFYGSDRGSNPPLAIKSKTLKTSRFRGFFISKNAKKKGYPKSFLDNLWSTRLYFWLLLLYFQSPIMHLNLIYLTGEPGDVLPPVPSLLEGCGAYEYIWRVYDHSDRRSFDCCLFWIWEIRNSHHALVRVERLFYIDNQ